MSDWLTLLVSVILSVGGGAGIASLVTARSIRARNEAETQILREKAPVEVDSIAVQGAEQAVLTMQRSMAAAEKRAERAERRISTLEQERDEDRRTIERLQTQLREVSLQAEHAEQAASAARQQASSLQEQLGELQRTYDRRAHGSH